MKLLTPLLIFGIIFLFGSTTSHAQVDLTGFDQLFNSAASNTGSSVGGGGTGQTDQSQTTDRDGGGSMNRLNANWPKVGKMVIRKTKLTWGDGIQPSKITLMEDDNIVFTTPVSGNSVAIDFPSLNLDVNKSYNLQISHDSISSKPTSLSFVNKSELDEVLGNLKNDITYKKASGVKKKLMKAFWLERNSLNYEAYEAYHIETADPTEMNIILSFFNDFKART